MIFEPFIIKKGSDFSVPLKVYADEGALITARLGDIEVTAISSADGVATLTLPSAGDWIVTAELDGTVLQPETITLPYYYEASFSFKGPRLPDGYIETQYISNPNLFDTLSANNIGGAIPFNGKRLEIEVDLTNILNGTASYGYILGNDYTYVRTPSSGRTGHGSGQKIYINKNGSVSLYSYYSSTAWALSAVATSATGSVIPGRNKIIVDAPKKKLIVNSLEYSYSGGNPSQSYTNLCYLFSCYNYSSQQMSVGGSTTTNTSPLGVCDVSIYEIKVFDSTEESTGDLIQDWIPYRKEDGEVGMFDIVRGEDYRIYSAYNASTKLVAGPDV